MQTYNIKKLSFEKTSPFYRILKTSLLKKKYFDSAYVFVIGMILVRYETMIILSLLYFMRFEYS